ncbi:unnamed protein product [Xylocopa violacea]|uniref:Uncharacterized protein n=1 Tax=Xylocopa violacea TaxID=135666 RepID=A0ABP1N8U8_XYLVO
MLSLWSFHKGLISNLLYLFNAIAQCLGSTLNQLNQESGSKDHKMLSHKQRRGARGSMATLGCFERSTEVDSTFWLVQSYILLQQWKLTVNLVKIETILQICEWKVSCGCKDSVDLVKLSLLGTVTYSSYMEASYRLVS